jgi:hypothetical protein
MFVIIRAFVRYHSFQSIYKFHIYTSNTNIYKSTKLCATRRSTCDLSPKVFPQLLSSYRPNRFCVLCTWSGSRKTFASSISTAAVGEVKYVCSSSVVPVDETGARHKGQLSC